MVYVPISNGWSERIVGTINKSLSECPLGVKLLGGEPEEISLRFP